MVVPGLSFLGGMGVACIYSIHSGHIFWIDMCSESAVYKENAVYTSRIKNPIYPEWTGLSIQ